MPTPERREYFKKKQREFRKRRRRADVSFGLDQYARLEEAAARHHMAVALFIRTCIDAYLSRSAYFIVPNAEAVRQLELGLRKIGGHINQIARRVNKARVADHQDIEDLYDRLADLEDAITGALREPPNLLDVIARALKDSPELAGEIRALLAEHRRRY